MEQMKRYIGVKIIEAVPGTMAVAQAMKSELPAKEIERIREQDKGQDGYIVKYPDGYISWSPKDVFEEAYRPCDNMTFGLAIEAMKKGKKVARKGWNGKSMFIYIQDGSRVFTHNLRADAIKDYYESRVIQHVNINPHIDMKAEDGSLVIGWVASQEDMLAEDWFIVE